MQLENKQELEEMAMKLLNEGIDREDKDQFYKGVKLVEKLREIEETEMTAENQAERLEVEREKLDSQEHCEELKQKISWKRALLEVSKVVIPGVISGGFFAWMVNKTGKFEETGTWHSQASRMVQNQTPRMKY